MPSTHNQIVKDQREAIPKEHPPQPCGLSIQMSHLLKWTEVMNELMLSHYLWSLGGCQSLITDNWQPKGKYSGPTKACQRVFSKRFYWRLRQVKSYRPNRLKSLTWKQLRQILRRSCFFTRGHPGNVFSFGLLNECLLAESCRKTTLLKCFLHRFGSISSLPGEKNNLQYGSIAYCWLSIWTRFPYSYRKA